MHVRRNAGGRSDTWRSAMAEVHASGHMGGRTGGRRTTINDKPLPAFALVNPLFRLGMERSCTLRKLWVRAPRGPPSLQVSDVLVVPGAVYLELRRMTVRSVRDKFSLTAQSGTCTRPRGA